MPGAAWANFDEDIKQIHTHNNFNKFDRFIALVL